MEVDDLTRFVLHHEFRCAAARGNRVQAAAPRGEHDQAVLAPVAADGTAVTGERADPHRGGRVDVDTPEVLRVDKGDFPTVG